MTSVRVVRCVRTTDPRTLGNELVAQHVAASRKGSNGMPNKAASHASEKNSTAVPKPCSAGRSSRHREEQIDSADALARAKALPASELSASNILALQSTAGNRAVQRMLGAMLGRPDSGAAKGSRLQGIWPPKTTASAEGAIR